jgi:dTDP-4-amino-4,6-dideoxygalactose transaminase
MELKKTPFNKVDIQGEELKYISKAISNGHISGDGEFTKKCKEILIEALSIENLLLTTSCTSALEMSAILLNIKPGDEVIVPSFTFVSTINAFVMRGAVPIFADIKSDTLNIDEGLLPELITNRTKAIIIVHYAGVACEMDTILDIASKRKISVIEDNAHGLFGKYKNKFLGTFGELAAQSFHETKNFSCGEGGALIINNKTYLDRAEIIREKGTNRSRFFRGDIDKYSWVDIGSSFLPSDILAAFLFGQLEQKDEIQKKRKEIWEYYYSGLEKWAKNNNIKLPFVPSYCDQAYHMFYLIMPSLKSRTRLIKYLTKNNFIPTFHYLPLHLSSMGKKYNGDSANCPITEHISDRIVRLPFFTNLKINDIDIDLFYDF